MINKNLIDFQEILDKILKYKDIDVNEKDDSIIFVSTILLLFFTQMERNKVNFFKEYKEKLEKQILNNSTQENISFFENNK